MTAFLEAVDCEIEISAESPEQAQEKARLFQAMLYLEGVGPFIMPFFTNWSLNSYAGINSRDSDSLRSKLPPGLREGLTSASGKVEAWLHEPTLKIIAIANRSCISSEMFQRAVECAQEWHCLEQRHAELVAARAALQTSPMIPDISSSLLHVWQGIESLFSGVSTEITFRISLLIAQLCSDEMPMRTSYQTARKSYKQRSNAAHGNLKKIGLNEWREAWELLVNCMISIHRRGNLVGEKVLIEEILDRDWVVEPK